MSATSIYLKYTMTSKNTNNKLRQINIGHFKPLCAANTMYSMFWCVSTRLYRVKWQSIYSLFSKSHQIKYILEIPVNLLFVKSERVKGRRREMHWVCLDISMKNWHLETIMWWIKKRIHRNLKNQVKHSINRLSLALPSNPISNEMAFLFFNFRRFCAITIMFFWDEKVYYINYECVMLMDCNFCAKWFSCNFRMNETDR